MKTGKFIRGKRLLSVTMALAMFSAMLPGTLEGTAEAAEGALTNPRIAADSSMEIGQKVTWDCVYFGSYPQSEVDSSETVYTALQNASGWDSENEITISGNKYRRMKKDDAEYAYAEKDNTEGEEGHYHWADDTTWHYFRYEPIKWRVLQTSGNRALLLSDMALDDKVYAATMNDHIWKNSRIRNWLNGYGTDFQNENFIGSAFSGAEQQSIQTSTLDEGNQVKDKIFLLSPSEIQEKTYGFLKERKPDGFVDIPDEAKRCRPSDYARAMGTFCITSEHEQYAEYPNTCWWWLREENGDTMPYVSYPGYTVYYGDYTAKCFGVRPAMWITLDSGQYTYAGTVCSDEMFSLEIKNPVPSNPGQPVKPKPGKPDEKSPAIGTKLTDAAGKAVYKVTDAGKVEYTNSLKKKSSAVTVPEKVTLDGKSYQVTAIGNSAFKNCKKLKTVVIGKGVTAIGAKAFNGCKVLKKITIKSAKLKKVGKSVFKGIYAKAVIKVPKAKLKAYQKLLKKKGQGKKVRITK